MKIGSGDGVLIYSAGQGLMSLSACNTLSVLLSLLLTNTGESPVGKLGSFIPLLVGVDVSFVASLCLFH